MRLPRPYIPLRVRVQVAERQASKFAMWRDAKTLGGKWTLQQRLDSALAFLFGEQRVELHHRPALLNRRRMWIEGGEKWYYDPDANDPDYLIYLPADEHDIETRVRGQHGDYSDLAKARKRKRIERKRKIDTSDIPEVGEQWFKKTKLKRPKSRWPKGRKLQSRGFPTRGKRLPRR